MTINELRKLFEKIQNESSLSRKKKILKDADCKDLREVLIYLYDNRITTGISRVRMAALKPNDILADATLSDAMKYIQEHNTGTDETAAAVKGFIERQNPFDKEFTKRLLTKVLKVGIDAKTVNSVFRGLVYVHEVQQGYPISNHPPREGVYFYLSQKLNGCRCTFINAEPISRQGLPITGIDYIADSIKKYNLSDWFVDGELIRDNVDGVSDNENFRRTISLVNSDMAVKPGLKFVIFDMFPFDQLHYGQSEWTYKYRKAAMLDLREMLDKDSHLEIVDFLYEGTNQGVISPLLDRMVFEDKEGLMLNLDVPYKCKRHTGCLKVKCFKSVDLKIIDMEEGQGRYAGMLGAFIVDYKGNRVGVGTGLTEEQRHEFWARGRTMIGKIIEVKYKEESKDVNGNFSLQFPTFVCERKDKTKESYN